jgi:hypothetical protein
LFVWNRHWGGYRHRSLGSVRWSRLSLREAKRRSNPHRECALSVEIALSLRPSQ